MCWAADSHHTPGCTDLWGLPELLRGSLTPEQLGHDHRAPGLSQSRWAPRGVAGASLGPGWFSVILMLSLPSRTL